MTRPWTSEEEGVNRHLDTLSSMLTSIGQRHLSEQQRDRFAQLLQRAERGLLAEFGVEALSAVKEAGAGLHALRCTNAPCSCTPIPVKP